MFRAYWTDQDGNPLEEIKRRVSEGTSSRVELNADAQLAVGAEIDVYEIPGWVNGRQHRVHLYKEYQGSSELLGEFVISNNLTDTRRGLKSTYLRLVDALQRLAAQYPTRPIIAPAGANVVGFVRGLIEEAGESNLEVTPSSAEFRIPQLWEPGSDYSILKICNEALASINYWAVHTRGGKFQIQPYLPPNRRPVSHSFIAGAGSLMVGEYSEDTAYLDVPNRFIAYSPGYGAGETRDDDQELLVGVAENRNPLSQFSYERSGFQWIDQVETVEADSQATIDAIAASRLIDVTGRNAYVEDIEHLYIPGLWINDRVYAETSAGDQIDAVVNEMSIFERGTVKARWRKVVSLE